MVALVDCNSFYASCEKLFRPDLADKPVAVLSNNDGCIVALSKEAKKLDIVPFATPYFKVKGRLSKSNVAVFSSNYTLYADISRRVMSLLARYSPEVEVYSIDEMFLNFDRMPYDLMQYALDIRGEVTQGVGVPVSVGISFNKTLSKVAAKIAKKSERGVAVLTEGIEDALKEVAVEEIWGIGRRYAALLRHYGIKTAYELTRQSDRWIKTYMTVVGLRLVDELRGGNAIAFEAPKDKQQIICSRSFSRKLTKLSEVEEAVASYAVMAAEKLRAQGTYAAYVSVFVQTPLHDATLPYSNSIRYRFDTPTADTLKLVSSAKSIVHAIYRPGDRYLKAGVMLTGIIPKDQVQLDLFTETKNSDIKREKLMELVDNLKKRYSLRWGAEGEGKSWQMKRDFLSPAYTTRWSDIPVVRIG